MTNIMFAVKKGEQTEKKARSLSSNTQLWIMSALPVLNVFVFCYLPMVGVIIAFKNYRFDLGIFGSEWVGLDNFVYFMRSNDFLRITRNTLGLNFLFMIAGTILSPALAIALFRVKRRKNVKTYQTFFIIPIFVSWVVVSYIVYLFLDPSNGLVNKMLLHMGLNEVSWYTTPGAWPAILTVVSMWKGVGIDSVIYYACLMGIDTALLEAAQIDGAGKWKTTIHIILPSLVPLLTTLSILKVGGMMRADFGLFYQVTRDVGSLYSVTDVIDTYIYRTMRVIGDMSMSAAVGLMQNIVGFVLVVVTNAIVKRVDESRALF